MKERRQIDRIKYESEAVLVLYESSCPFMVRTTNVSPLGMCVIAGSKTPNILGETAIIVTDTLIMFSIITRQTKRPDGTYELGLKAKRLDREEKEFLFDVFQKGNKET